MVREDSALAYHLQNKEIDEHLSGNKYRNAVVREDFPRAKNEQLREQQMAEQAAAIYQKMLAEQEEIDKQVAKELADRMDQEERMKRRALELRDQDIARQLLDKERIKVERHHQMPLASPLYSPQRPVQPPPRVENQSSPHRPNSLNYRANLPRRQALAMPLPQLDSPEVKDLYSEPIRNKPNHFNEINSAEYNEPYISSQKLSDQLNRIDIAEVGLPLNELSERRIQEEKDAELARKLQEQEATLEESLLNRDRLLAIEAQDKELAKLLQERERAKAKRAHVLPQHASSVPRSVAAYPDVYAVPNPDEDVTLKKNESLYEGESKEANSVGASSNNPSLERGMGPNASVSRPTHLDLRSPLTRLNKNHFDSEACDSASSGQSASSPAQHTNIAMAIDPTYSRRGYRLSSSYDTASSTVTTSTSSSSPGLLLPPPDISEQEDDNPAPPYMPIQGQRRTASLEKKQKKKNKDGGCKQQ
ncbi:hypothetical protein NQ318_019404 [Aromia moschata]|uniref:Coiled-coil domain-containing protein n=1 Tax=Aromia moschata TaxID=1265417 RepID=A0AAV8XFB6_9CUCU|nr:hypothetical protein NQ318_019404 [Aromia moschata]